MTQIENTVAADYPARWSRSGLKSASKIQKWEDRATRHVSNKAIFTPSASAHVQKQKQKKSSTDQIIWIKDVFARHLAAQEDFSPASSDLNTHNCILMSTDLLLVAIFIPFISFFLFFSFLFFFYLESTQTYMNMNILQTTPTFLSSSSRICLTSKSKQEVLRFKE